MPGHNSHEEKLVKDIPVVDLNGGTQIPQLGFGVFQIEPGRVVDQNGSP